MFKSLTLILALLCNALYSNININNPIDSDKVVRSMGFFGPYDGDVNSDSLSQLFSELDLIEFFFTIPPILIGSSKVRSCFCCISVGVEKYKIFLLRDCIIKYIEKAEINKIKIKKKILFLTFFVSI